MTSSSSVNAAAATATAAAAPAVNPESPDETMSEQADRFAALLHEQHQLVTMYDGSSLPPPGLEGLEPIDECDNWLDPKRVLSAAGIAAMRTRDAPDTAPSAGPPRNNGWVVYTQEEVATHTLKVSQWVGWKHWEDRQQPHQHEHQQQQQQQHHHHYTEAAADAHAGAAAA